MVWLAALRPRIVSASCTERARCERAKKGELVVLMSPAGKSDVSADDMAKAMVIRLFLVHFRHDSNKDIRTRRDADIQQCAFKQRIVFFGRCG